jgi:hypothetical protein
MDQKISLPILILSLFLAGCERIALNEPFSAKVGDRFRVDSNLSFSVDSVNDYRCPLLFECIWGGDVKMFCTFYEPHHDTDTAIYLVSSGNMIRMGGYSFKLLTVDPQSQRGELIPQNEYKLDIIVQKE